MSSVNKVFLVGRLGKDPEMKGSIATFSLATNHMSKGEKKTEWHDIVCFDKTASAVVEYLKKGSLACVEGRIETNEWTDKLGVKQARKRITASNVNFLEPKASTHQGGFSTNQSSATPELEDIPF